MAKSEVVRLRITPELSFEYDDAMERGANISELLKKTAQTDDAGQEGENEDE